MDTTTNTLGYDVSEILSYAGFLDARINQAIEIKYALVGDTITVGNELGRTLGTFSYAPSDNSTPYAYSTMSMTSNAGPTVLSGVSAIEVKYIDNMFDGNTGTVGAAGNFTAYKQFAVIGTATAMPGDANRDGAVDHADASILGAHWQTASGATWEMGDFNGDGAVNDMDAAQLAAHWTATAEQAVPEPSTLAGLLGLWLVGLLELCLAGSLALARRKGPADARATSKRSGKAR